MTVYECDDSIVVVDAGLAFPRDEHLGVDLVLPDFSYLRETRQHQIRAVILTHGHEDHVGGLPYLMREVPIPEVWATRLTLGLVKSKLDEHGLLRAAELREVHPDDPPRELGPFRIEFVRMAHSIPDAVAIVHRDAGRADRAHRRLQARPHAGRRAQDGRRPARRARQPRRRSPARRLDQRRAARLHASERIVGEAFRQIFPLRARPHPRLLVRLERPPDAAGRRRGGRARPQGLHRRTLDAQEHEHRAQPRLHGRARGRARAAGRARGDPAARAAHPLHGQPGRAAVRADADRVQRPSGHPRRARRHGDHLGEARAGERAARARHDQPAREDRRGGAAPGDRARPRLRPCLLGGAAHASGAVAAQSGDARARRVPHAGRACAARTRRGRAGGEIVLAENGTVVELSRDGRARSSTRSRPA